jgi:hypothetical protein
MPFVFVGNLLKLCSWKPAGKDARTPEKPQLAMIIYKLCASYG